MKILRISALSFIILGATHFAFINLLNPQENHIAWYETASARSNCKTVYDTVTSASGQSSRKARTVCDPIPSPAPTPMEPVKPVLVSKPIDTEPPRIQISHPQNQAHVPYDTDQIQVSGSVLDNQDRFPSLKIYTAGLSDTLSNFGEVSLREGQNDIHIRAEDKTHNGAEKIITVFRDSPPKPKPKPEPVKAETPPKPVPVTKTIPPPQEIVVENEPVKPILVSKPIDTEAPEIQISHPQAQVETPPKPVPVIKTIPPPQEIIVENKTSEKQHQRQLIALEREKIIAHYLAQLQIQQLLNRNL